MPFWSKKDKEKDSLSKDSKSAAPSSQANPYAVQPQSNDPYAQKTNSFGQQPPPYDNRSAPASGLGQDKSPVPPGGYAGGPPPPQGRFGREPAHSQQQGGYGGSSNYGQQSGYGSNAYGAEQPSQSRYGPSGYGGLGRTNSQETTTTDAGRAALFGNAPQRQQQQQQQQAEQSTTPQGEEAPSSFGGYGGSGTATANTSSYGGYGAAPDRELTAEEQEEEDVQAAKNEIKFIKQQDVSSTRNARRIAEQTEAIGRETLARLGQQGERIHNTERNLDLASHQNRLAEEKARELKTLNRSMFAVHVANPFTAKKREEAANAIALDKHRRERERADETRANAYSSVARQQGFERELKGAGGVGAKDKASLAQRSKYQFAADSEDDEMENEIDGAYPFPPLSSTTTRLRPTCNYVSGPLESRLSLGHDGRGISKLMMFYRTDNLDAIHRGAKTLNQLGRAMGTELDAQNQHINRITGKVDKVDDDIAVNRARLERISKRG